MDYRRARLKGGLYFFTLVTHNRLPLLETAENLNLLKQAVQHVNIRHPFKQLAYVMLPDHVHCIWQLPEDKDDFSTRWRLVKHYVSCHTPQQRPFWQKRFWEHLIQGQDDYHKHLDYIHYNPVKHGLVKRPREWPHSSYHDFLRIGWYEPGWGETTPETEGEFGE